MDGREQRIEDVVAQLPESKLSPSWSLEKALEFVRFSEGPQLEFLAANQRTSSLAEGPKTTVR